MIVSKDLKLATVQSTVAWPRPAPRPGLLFRLRAAFWATSLLRQPELHLYADRLELQVPQMRRCLVHRVRYERVRRVELVEGRRFTDVVFVTDGGGELVVPGIRNRDLAPVRTYLAGVTA